MKLHSKRVEKMIQELQADYTRLKNEVSKPQQTTYYHTDAASKITLETSGENVNLHSKRVEKT